MNLTDEEIRIKVAEAMGTMCWSYALPTKCIGASVPNYPESLNACAEFEATLTDHELMLMHHQITKILRQMKDPRPAWRAPAKVRCLAYLKTKGILP